MARRLLQEAELIDEYRTRCAASPMNYAAREGQIYEPSFVKPFFATRLNNLADSIPLLDSAKIVVLHESADNGYPHTRPGNIVCMPTGVCTGDADDLKTTLTHEAMHLHQRIHASKWNGFIQSDGWTPRARAEIPETLRATCRINPDTMAVPFWSWQSYYVPLPLFVSKPTLGLGDSVVKWYDLRNRVVFSDPPASFYTKYGLNVPQPEHPYEIYAVKFADNGIHDETALWASLSG